MHNHRSFWGAGFRVFGIFGATQGKCDCGNPRCPPATLHKHPVMTNWQYAPVWSDEQMETMESVGAFASGYGVLCHELLVVDVDERRGGLASYAALVDAIPQVAGAGLVVETGSGGGSKHLYFRIPPDVALVTHHRSYPGIDFKNGAAFVIGPGSRHASGRTYTTLTGSPDEVSDAPPELLALLQKPKHHRAEYAGRPVDVSFPQLQDMLAHIPNTPDVSYDEWLAVGMALHHATGGSGYELWDTWSASGPKHSPGYGSSKWHSFGKSVNPVTLGTLVHYAQKGGWREPVTFVADPEFQFAAPQTAPDIDISGCDLKRPPGAVGVVAKWIEDQTRRPREALSAVAAICAVGNVIGLRYTDDIDKVTSNIFMFGVADSGTGKEAVQTAVREIHAVAGLSPATHGALKSEQEVARNLTRHQMCAYVLDEVGITLRKIKNAQARGGAPYLDGIIGILMSAYSKGNGHFLLSGDMKEDVRAGLEKRLGALERKLDDEGGNRILIAQRDNVARMLSTLDQGLEKPFLSVCGFTTLKTFNEVIDFENAANGFIGRSLLAVELESAPPRKRGFQAREMPENLAMLIRQLASGGDFDLDSTADRVESYKPRRVVPTTEEAAVMLELVGDLFDEQAMEQKGTGGLEALSLRGAEMVAKVSLILAAPEGLRTAEHVRWAYALAKKDIEKKTQMVVANDRAKDDPASALRAKILSLIDDDVGETLGVIVNRARGYKREDVELVLGRMVDAGDVVMEITPHKFNKSLTHRYKTT